MKEIIFNFKSISIYFESLCFIGGPGKQCRQLASVVMVGGLTAAGAGLVGPGDSVSVSIITLGTLAPQEMRLYTLIHSFTLHMGGLIKSKAWWWCSDLGIFRYSPWLLILPLSNLSHLYSKESVLLFPGCLFQRLSSVSPAPVFSPSSLFSLFQALR